MALETSAADAKIGPPRGLDCVCRGSLRFLCVLRASAVSPAHA